MQGLFATVTNVNFDPARIDELKKMAETMTLKLGGAKEYNGSSIFQGDQDIVSFRSMLLSDCGEWRPMPGMRACWEKRTQKSIAWLYKGLRSIGEEHSGETNGWHC